MNKEIKVKDLKRVYDPDFKPTREYLDSMPDLQNGEFIGIPIETVGISDFKLPIRIKQKDGDTQEVIASITGSVSLDGHSRGINMSRILRTFYKSKDDIFDINKLVEILHNYKRDLNTFDASILMNFEYRLWQDSLRSTRPDGTPEGGYQYYNITFDVSLDKQGEITAIMWIDYKYSSACPCSTELSNHAALTRGVYGIPHSQRSVARIGIKFDPQNLVWIEDVIDSCRDALVTEVLVFCKREDEQAFAELNGSQPKFVEDSIRLLAKSLDHLPGVENYKIICSHLESLHAHNAISMLLKQPNNGFSNGVSWAEYKDLVC